MKDNDSIKIVRSIAIDEKTAAVTNVVSSTQYRPLLDEWIIKTVDKEATRVCSTKDPSIISKCVAESLLEYSDQKFVIELKERAPLLYLTLHSAAVKHKKRTKIMRGASKDTSIPIISMSAAVLMKEDVALYRHKLTE